MNGIRQSPQEQAFPAILERTAGDWASDIESFDYSLLQHPLWIEAMATPRMEPLCLDFAEDGRTVAKFSGFIVRSPLGRYLYSYAGLCAPRGTELDARTTERCYTTLHAYARKRRLYRIGVGSYGSPAAPPCFPRPFRGFRRDEFIIDLTAHDEARDLSSVIVNHLKKKSRKIRYEIVNTRDPAALAYIRRLMEATLEERGRKHNDRYNPLSLRHLTWEALAGMLKNGLASITYVATDGEPRSLCFDLERGSQMYGILKANSPVAYAYGLSSVLAVHMIRTCKERNLRILNLGGVTSGPRGEGVARYKMNQGAKRTPLHGGVTDYIVFPHAALNPLASAARRMSPILSAYRFLRRRHGLNQHFGVPGANGRP